MKIALIHCPFGHRKFSENLRFVDEEFILPPPLILAYVAAILEKSGHQVILIDTHSLKLNKNEVLKIIREFGADLLAFRVDAYNFHQTREWIKFLKENTSLPTIIGGIGITQYPLESMIWAEIDFGIIGEALYSLPNFINALENKEYHKFRNIEGLAWKENGKIQINPPSHEVANFDSYPFPARHLLPNHIYHSFVSQRRNFSIMLTITGCPYNCTFCAISPLPYRARSVPNVVEELKECHYKYGIREIDIFDATFFIDKERVANIFEELIRLNLDLEWTCRGRIDLVDEEIMRLGARSGLRMVNWGIESSSQDVLDNICKGINISQVKNTINIAKKYGIRSLGFFMIGNQGDTKNTIKESINFSKSLGLDYIQVCRTIAKPGSLLHKYLVEKTRQDYWSDFISGKIGEQRIPTPWTKMTSLEVEKLLKIFYYNFYFRPSFIFKTILKIRSFSELFRYVRVGLKVVISHMFSDIQ